MISSEIINFINNIRIGHIPRRSKSNSPTAYLSENQGRSTKRGRCRQAWDLRGFWRGAVQLVGFRRGAGGLVWKCGLCCRGLCSWAAEGGPPTLGRPCPPTWRGSDICALCVSQQQEIETPNLHVESAIFYQILGYSSAAVHLKPGEQWQHAEARCWMNGVLHTFPICWGLHTTGLGLCWQGSASRGRSKA